MTGHLLLAAALVSSSSLGYETPYWGAKAEGMVQSGRWVLQAQGAYYDAEKVGAGDGHGARARALGGVELGKGITLLAGAVYSRQETSAWTKQGVAPMVEIRWQDGLGTLIGSVEHLDDSDDEQWVCALEARVGKKYSVFGRYEYVDYKTLFAEGYGHRYETGILIPLWQRR